MLHVPDAFQDAAHRAYRDDRQANNCLVCATILQDSSFLIYAR